MAGPVPQPVWQYTFAFMLYILLIEIIRDHLLLEIIQDHLLLGIIPLGHAWSIVLS